MTANTADLPTASCIIRFHDIQKVGYLERALQSVHGQIDVRISPIVVLQNFSERELETLEGVVRRNWFFEHHSQPVIANLAGSGNADQRSKLLNLGIEWHLRSGNRYLGFLDYDDFLYSHAYKLLTTTLIKRGAAVAFATIEQLDVVPLWDYDFIYRSNIPYQGKNKLDLLNDNFCPIHSYLLDTTRIDQACLHFREDMSRVEDYEFLIRVAGQHPCDFRNVGQKIGGYVMRSDGSNSTPDWSKNDDQNREKIAAWKDDQMRLDETKAATEVRFFASDF